MTEKEYAQVIAKKCKIVVDNLRNAWYYIIKK